MPESIRVDVLETEWVLQSALTHCAVERFINMQSDEYTSFAPGMIATKLIHVAVPCVLHTCTAAS